MVGLMLYLNAHVAWWVYPYLTAAEWCCWVFGTYNIEVIVETALEGVTFDA
jgi:hypothetical protein